MYRWLIISGIVVMLTGFPLTVFSGGQILAHLFADIRNTLLGGIMIFVSVYVFKPLVRK